MTSHAIFPLLVNRKHCKLAIRIVSSLQIKAHFDSPVGHQMQEFFSSKHRRRTFFLIVSTVLLLLGIFRYDLLPDVATSVADITFGQAIASIVDDLITTVLVTVALASFLFWITPPVMHTAEVEVLEPRQIRETLEKAKIGAAEWWFSGGCGRYTRAVTIPYLAEKSRAENTAKRVHVLLIDPRCEESCRFYAEYRNQVRSAESGSPWSADRVRAEVLATITATYAWKARHPLLGIQVGLREHFSLHRLDISTHMTVLTREDPQEPGLRSDAGSFFYQSFLDDVRLGMRQAHRLDSEVDLVPLDQLTPEILRQFFVRLRLTDETVSIELLNDVIERARRHQNPYA